MSDRLTIAEIADCDPAQGVARRADSVTFGTILVVDEIAVRLEQFCDDEPMIPPFVRTTGFGMIASDAVDAAGPVFCTGSNTSIGASNSSLGPCCSSEIDR